MKYPFHVTTHWEARTGGAFRPATGKDFQTLGAAMEYAKAQSRQRFVAVVEVKVLVATFREGREAI